MAKITKEQILSGIKHIETISMDSMDGNTMYIRPLSVTELSNVRQIEAKAIGNFETLEKTARGKKNKSKSVMETKGKLNLEKTSEASTLANIQKVYYSLDNDEYKDDKFTEEDIKAFPAGFFEELVEKINDFNNIDEENESDAEKDVKDFPEDEGI